MPKGTKCAQIENESERYVGIGTGRTVDWKSGGELNHKGSFIHLKLETKHACHIASCSARKENQINKSHGKYFVPKPVPIALCPAKVVSHGLE